MMSVMGILILVTLMLALDLATTVALASRKPPALQEPQRDQEAVDLADLARQVEQWRKEYEASLLEVIRIAEAAGGKSHEIKIAIARLERAHEQIREFELEAAQYAKALAEEAGKDANAWTKLREISRLEQEMTYLQSMIDAERRNPRLTYIVQAGQTKSPILVELGERAIGIGFPDEGQPVLWLTGDDVAMRLRQLSALATSRDVASEYFIILVKPSAFSGRYEGVKMVLTQAGFQVGTDLISERAVVLPKASRQN
jgi:hypothetical protein